MKNVILKIHDDLPVDLLARICKTVDEYAAELGIYDRCDDVVVLNEGKGHLEFAAVSEKNEKEEETRT